MYKRLIENRRKDCSPTKTDGWIAYLVGGQVRLSSIERFSCWHFERPVFDPGPLVLWRTVTFLVPVSLLFAAAEKPAEHEDTENKGQGSDDSGHHGHHMPPYRAFVFKYKDRR